MGNSASKAARKLPKRAETPSWAGKKTLPPDAHPTPPKERLASEQRTKAIEEDAGDPHLLANLNRLGPVRVDHHMQTIRPEATATERMFKSREQSEAEAYSPQRHKNRLNSISLSELLDERKAARTYESIQKLSEKYGIDVEKLNNVTRYVSSPSVDTSSVKVAPGKDGEETVTMKAVWIEPAIKS